MQPFLSRVPIMVVEGNHEIEQQAENQTFVAYSSRFAFPSDESGSSSTFYYSFNAGGIHFIMLGAYISYDRSGEPMFKSLSHFVIFLQIYTLQTKLKDLSFKNYMVTSPSFSIQGISTSGCRGTWLLLTEK